MRLRITNCTQTLCEDAEETHTGVYLWSLWSHCKSFIYKLVFFIMVGFFCVFFFTKILPQIQRLLSENTFFDINIIPSDVRFSRLFVV